MKKIILVALCLVAFTQTSKAQFTASVGAEVVLPLGDFGKSTSFGAGLSVGGEYAIDDNMGVTGQVGYIHMITTKEIKSAYMMPIQAGFKYYIDSNEEGFYLHGQLGVHLVGVTTKGLESKEHFFTVETRNVNIKTTTTNMSYAIGGGFLVNENIDLGLRYNIISTEGTSSSYLATRIAYNF